MYTCFGHAGPPQPSPAGYYCQPRTVMAAFKAFVDNAPDAAVQKDLNATKVPRSCS
ncbi:hypothetical protein SAMN04488069_10718 [Hymenobacter psychrophilus]|uniref:Uncharacterized protein n=1 Tax=Hymenobacter psychrophilus TaxID=651662 RepID=A0A1H3IID6_9BACT|nr:hypothetical protein SAMN04488069_10718 [Hymenobacter psychrophilus]